MYAHMCLSPKIECLCFAQSEEVAPEKCRFSSGNPGKGLTCAGDAGEHPALAVLDGLGAVPAPLLEDGHAAGPPVRCDPARVWLLPTTGQHTLVTVGVHLDQVATRKGAWSQDMKSLVTNVQFLFESQSLY